MTQIKIPKAFYDLAAFYAVDAMLSYSKHIYRAFFAEIRDRL
jgi:hypothetical protein